MEGDVIEIIMIYSVKGFEWLVVILINIGILLCLCEVFVYCVDDEILYWLIGDVVLLELFCVFEFEDDSLVCEWECFWYVVCMCVCEFLIVLELF